MNNNRGSAVGLVLLILAVVSILGVGLLAQSRLDVRLTSAMRSYDRMFNMADGAASVAYEDLCEFNHTMGVPLPGEDPLEKTDTPARYWIRNKDNVKLQELQINLDADNRPAGVPAGAEAGFDGSETISAATVMLGAEPIAMDLPGYDPTLDFKRYSLVAEGRAYRWDAFNPLETDTTNDVEHRVYVLCEKIVSGD